MKAILSIAAASLLMVGAAHAQQSKSPMYGELAYAPIKLSGGGGSDPKLGMLRGIAGFNLDPNVAVEGMLGLGIKDDTSTIGGLSTKTKLERTLGVFVKPKYAVTNEFEVFGRLGYANTKIKQEAVTGSGSSSKGTLAYGAGVSYSFAPTMYVTGDYMSYYKKDNVKLKGVSVGLGFRF